MTGEASGGALPTDPDHGRGDVVHVVLFRFREAVPVEQRRELERRFLALAESERDGRRYIRAIRSGAQVSPEGAGHGFEVGFVVEFSSLGDRNYYLGRPFVGDGPFDPAHAAFTAFAGPLLEGDGRGALVFDLVAGG